MNEPNNNSEREGHSDGKQMEMKAEHVKLILCFILYYFYFL